MTFLEPNLERFYIWCSRLQTSFEEDEDLEAEYELASHVFQMHRDLGNRPVAADVIDHMQGFEVSQSEPEAARIKLYSGIVALDDGDLEQAERHLESALSEREEFYGRLHPFTLEVGYALACVAESQGRIREAFERMDKVINVWKDLVPKRHSASRKIDELYRRLRRLTV